MDAARRAGDDGRVQMASVQDLSQEFNVATGAAGLPLPLPLCDRVVVISPGFHSPNVKNLPTFS